MIAKNIKINFIDRNTITISFDAYEGNKLIDSSKIEHWLAVNSERKYVKGNVGTWDILDNTSRDYDLHIRKIDDPYINNAAYTIPVSSITVINIDSTWPKILSYEATPVEPPSSKTQLFSLAYSSNYNTEARILKFRYDDKAAADEICTWTSLKDIKFEVPLSRVSTYRLEIRRKDNIHLTAYTTFKIDTNIPSINANIFNIYKTYNSSAKVSIELISNYNTYCEVKNMSTNQIVLNTTLKANEKSKFLIDVRYLNVDNYRITVKRIDNDRLSARKYMSIDCIYPVFIDKFCKLSNVGNKLKVQVGVNLPNNVYDLYARLRDGKGNILTNEFIKLEENCEESITTHVLTAKDFKLNHKFDNNTEYWVEVKAIRRNTPNNVIFESKLILKNGYIGGTVIVKVPKVNDNSILINRKAVPFIYNGKEWISANCYVYYNNKWNKTQ